MNTTQVRPQTSDADTRPHRTGARLRPLEPREDVVLDLESPRTRAALTMLGLERADVDPEVAFVPSCRSLENCW